MNNRSQLAVPGTGGAAPPQTKAYLVGGGIAALASAAYLIRDAGLAGKNIHIFEELDVVGGSLDGRGAADEGYVIRGGGMFADEAYTCTLDLLSFIPALSDRAILRDPGRCRLHRGVLGPVRADRSLCAVQHRQGRHATVQGPA